MKLVRDVLIGFMTPSDPASERGPGNIITVAKAKLPQVIYLFCTDVTQARCAELREWLEANKDLASARIIPGAHFHLVSGLPQALDREDCIKRLDPWPTALFETFRKELKSLIRATAYSDQTEGNAAINICRAIRSLNRQAQRLISKASKPLNPLIVDVRPGSQYRLTDNLIPPEETIEFVGKLRQFLKVNASRDLRVIPEVKLPDVPSLGDPDEWAPSGGFRGDNPRLPQKRGDSIAVDYLQKESMRALGKVLAPKGFKKVMGKKLLLLLILGALVLGGCFSRPGAPLAQNPPVSGGPAELVVEKLEPTVALPNQPFPAELRIRNLGRETLVDVEVVLDLPAGLEVINAVPSAPGPGLFWRFDRLGPGEILHIHLTMRGPAGEFPNAVRVRAAKPLTAEATGVVVLSAIAGITAFLTDEPGVVPVGAPVTYILVLKGQGYGKAQGVTVEIKIPEGMRLKAVEAPVKHALAGQTLSFEPFSLAAGDEARLTFTLVADQAGDMVVRALVAYQGFKHRIVLEEGTVVYGP